jgi:serine/threonine-protein kinase RsbW
VGGYGPGTPLLQEAWAHKVVIEVTDEQDALRDQLESFGRRGRLRAARLRCEGVPAVAGRLPGLRRRITDWARQVGLRPERIDALRLACDEALANVVQHAYRGGRGVLHLYATYQPERDKVTVTVVDHGRWRLRRPSRQFGLTLMRGLADRVDVTTGPNGTTVRLSWAKAHAA